MGKEDSLNLISGGKMLPYSLDVERQVIGSLFLSEEALAKAQEKLEGDDFYLDKHQILFTAVSDMGDQGQQVDLITLREYLQKKGELVKAGGEAYLIEIAGEVVSWANIEQHCEIVREKSILRNLIKSCNTILEDCYKGQMDAMDVLDTAEATIYQIGETQNKSGFAPIQEVLKETFKLIEAYSNQEIIGVSSGYTDLDALTGGFQKTDLIIIAGRPAMGKTALALNFLANAALKHNKTVAFFSLEMGREQLVQRVLCKEASINQQLLRTGKLPNRDYGKLIDAAGKLHNSKIYIDDNPGQTTMQIRSKCRRLALSSSGLDMVMIDYLQLMNGSGRQENRQQEISQISRALKGLAKELQIPVIALSQLNRLVESRGDGRPMLSDLRESGAIEQDADLVMFIYREEVYKPDDPALHGKAEVILAKQRNGPVGTATLTFIKECAAFENYSPRIPQDGGF